jgi:hypothetical protein
MTYDWQTIFKSKTTKELYDIYMGTPYLPNETKEFAEQELHRRNFNFETISTHKTAWELSSLEEDYSFRNSPIGSSGIVRYSFTGYLITIAYVLVGMFLLTSLYLEDTIEQIITAIIAAAILAILVIFKNKQYKRFQAKNKKTLQRIEQLRKKLTENADLENYDLINKDIEKDKIIEKSNLKTMRNIYIVIFSILFLCVLYRIFFR